MMEPGSQMNVFRLLNAPHKWSPEHLTGLRIEERNCIHCATIFDGAPGDDDDDDQGNNCNQTPFRFSLGYLNSLRFA